MIKKCYINVKDEVNCFITGLSPNDLDFFHNKYGVYVEGYRWMPAFKLGRWNGKVQFFEKTGKTYVRLLDEIVPFLDTMGYEIDLVDNRAYTEPPVVNIELLEFDETGIATSASADIFPGVEIGGKPFALRPYQAQCVKAAIEAGSGIILAGTGAGKCLSGCTTINIKASDKLKKAIEHVRTTNIPHV